MTTYADGFAHGMICGVIAVIVTSGIAWGLATAFFGGR